MSVGRSHSRAGRLARRAAWGLGVVAVALAIALRSRTLTFDAEARPPISDVDEAAIRAGASEIVSRAHDVAAFEGCAVVALHGKIVAERCTNGFTPSTRFSIASLGKNFTGLLVQELAARGALSLDDRIETHVPELAGSPAGRVSITSLLHMTSGLPYVIDLSTNVRTQLSSDSGDDDGTFLREARTFTLAFEPGSADLYSNVGYGLLAILVGRVEHRPWRDVMRDRFGREGMGDTGFMRAHAASASGVVPGHVPLRCGLVLTGVCLHEMPQWNYAMLPGGGIYSSVRDLFTWDRALKRIENESPALYRAFIEPSPWGFASGWDVSRSAGADGHARTLFTYVGEDPGYFAFFARIPDLDAAIIVLSSTDFTLVRSRLDLFGALKHLVLGEPYEVLSAGRM